MTVAPLLAAAAEACRALDALGYRSCLIGGLAVQRWGQPRVTQDVEPFETALRQADRLG